MFFNSKLFFLWKQKLLILLWKVIYNYKTKILTADFSINFLMNTFILLHENFKATELYFQVQSNGSGERHIIKTTMINEMQLSRKKVL